MSENYRPDWLIGNQIINNVVTVLLQNAFNWWELFGNSLTFSNKIVLQTTLPKMCSIDIILIYIICTALLAHLLSYRTLYLTEDFRSCFSCKAGVGTFECTNHGTNPEQKSHRNKSIRHLLADPTSRPHQSHASDQPCPVQDSLPVHCQLWNKIEISALQN